MSALAEPATEGSAGLLTLELGRNSHGTTVVRRRCQRFPLRITTALYPDPELPDMAYIYVQNPTGGVFGDDQLAVCVDVAPQARAHITTQSATKLYRTENGESEQVQRFCLSPGSYLEVMPDVLIPQAGSRYRQDTRAEVGCGATLLASDILAPGRTASEEALAYQQVALSFAATRDGRDLVAENMDLRPAAGLLRNRGALGQRAYLASAFLISPEEDTERLARLLGDAVSDFRSLAACDLLPNGCGVLVRALCPSRAAAENVIREVWRLARAEILGCGIPLVRK